MLFVFFHNHDIVDYMYNNNSNSVEIGYMKYMVWYHVLQII